MGNLIKKHSNKGRKIIRPNSNKKIIIIKSKEIEIGQLTNIEEISTIKAISDLIQIDEKYI